MNKLIGKPFFFRITALVLTILIISLIFTTIIYTLASEEIFISYQTERLKEETDMLASLIPNEWRTKDLLEQFFDKVFQVESTILSSYVVISDKINVEMYSYVPSSQRAGIVIDKDAMDRFYKQNLSQYFKRVLSGQYISLENDNNEFNKEMIILMRPILSDTGSVEAVLTVCKFVEDYSIQLEKINKTLIIAMLAVFLLMLYPVYLLSKSITKPLFEVKDVAIAMGKGDFSVRANENYPAEIGQLSTTMNLLSSELDSTINHLKRETNVLQGVLNSMNEGILVIDKYFNPIIINPATGKLFNTDIKSSDKLSIIPKDEIWKDFEKCIETNMSVDNTYNFNEIMIQCIINPVIVNNEIVGAMGIFSDITKEVRLEQTRREYVANVSHELKTPLTGVMGLIEPLKDGLVTDKDKINRYYELISNEVLRLNRLINDLLVLSRLQSSNEAFSMEKVNLTEIINDIVERYLYYNKDQIFNIKCNIPKEPVFILGNGDRIDQILTILVDNALKFGKDDVDVTLCIEISLTKENNKYIVSVADNGKGISKDDLPYIFERFFKTDKSRSKSGSGLGLSIAKETLLRMNEKIWVESDESVGSVFKFTLSNYLI
ncbi:MAG: cell wall metabolism sensor histidine kinase WalK [Clostridiaceae bacterium]|nr:cell wall metabolism sensor histidine kinase WalK [Clostridiaceae bacterium]